MFTFNKIIVAGILAAGLVVATSVINRPHRRAASTTSARLAQSPVLWDVPDFAFRDQDGKAVTAQDLRGKVWVADFIFTGCAGACPQLTQRMAALSRACAGHPVQFVSFDVDPDHDTPEKLRQYGQTFHADFQQWHFLLPGSRADIFALARSMHVTSESDDRNFQILHSNSFILVDAKGQVRGVFDATHDADFARLWEAVGSRQ